MDSNKQTKKTYENPNTFILLLGRSLPIMRNTHIWEVIPKSCETVVSCVVPFWNTIVLIEKSPPQ